MAASETLTETTETAEAPIGRTLGPRAVALAAAVEALSTGHARVLAAELRALLDEVAGPRAAVVGLDAEARKRGLR